MNDQRKTTTGRLIGRMKRFDRRAKAAARIVLGSGIAEWAAIGTGIAAAFVAFFTAYQIWVDLEDRREERIERNEARIDRAYETLTRKIGGDTGKGQALSLLIRNNVPLGNLDLSCRAIGTWDDKNQRCGASVVFSQLIAFLSDEPDTASDRTPARLPNMRHALIVDSDLRSVDLADNFDETLLAHSDLRGSTLSADNVRVERSDFRFGTLSLKAKAPFFNFVNVSGAVIMRVIDPPSENADMAALFAETLRGGKRWYWSDNPPRIYWERTEDTIILDDDQMLDPKTLKGFLECDARDRKKGTRVSSQTPEFVLGAIERVPDLVPVREADLTAGTAKVFGTECYLAFSSIEGVLIRD